MKKVIALRGLANTGKSSTLRKVYELLVSEYTLQPQRLNVKIEGVLNDVNIGVIVSVNGVRIGITSEGDNAEILAAKLRGLEYKGCAIIVCASRTAPWFETIVNNLQRSGYEAEWIEKRTEGTTKPERDAANLLVAQEIVSRIKDLL
jgi:hypothetical protein